MQVVSNKNGYIETVVIDGNSISLPWGVEFGDSYGFFSQTDSGIRSVSKNIKTIIKKSFIFSSDLISLKEGKIKLNSYNYYGKNQIKREVVAKTLTEIYLMDFVVRYRFKKKFFKFALINGNKILHNKSNLYYQYPVNEAFLFGKDFKIKISLNKSNIPEGFNPCIYVRDFSDEWIIHCRLIPSRFDKLVLKLNVPWYNKAIPQFFSKLLLYIPSIKNMTWYRTELRKFHFLNFFCRLLKPSSYPLVKLKKGTRIAISSTFKIEKI